MAAGSLATRQQGSPSSVLEDLPDTLVGLGRALEVLVGTNLLANLLTLFSHIGISILSSQAQGRTAHGSTLFAYRVDCAGRSLGATWGLPLQERRASGWSCEAPRSSSGRSADPSCSRPE